jgi:hypothetical protein
MHRTLSSACQLKRGREGQQRRSCPRTGVNLNQAWAAETGRAALHPHRKGVNIHSLSLQDTRTHTCMTCMHTKIKPPAHVLCHHTFTLLCIRRLMYIHFACRDKRKASSSDDDVKLLVAPHLAAEPEHLSHLHSGKSAKPKLDLMSMKPLPSKSKKIADSTPVRNNEHDIREDGVPVPKHAWEGDYGNGGSNAPSRPKMSFQLDLSKTRELPREQTETQLRAEKLKRYETECSKVNDFMYVGGIKVAQVCKNETQSYTCISCSDFLDSSENART